MNRCTLVNDEVPLYFCSLKLDALIDIYGYIVYWYIVAFQNMMQCWKFQSVRNYRFIHKFITQNV